MSTALQKHEISATKAVHAVFAYSWLLLLFITASLPCDIAADGN